MRRPGVLVAAFAAFVLGVPAVSAARPAPLVAFACDTAGTYDLYVARLDGSGLRRVTDGVSADTGPSWSPDGKRLVFWSKLATTSDLTVVAADGTGRRVLVAGTQPDSLHRLFPPAWSPDGRWIAFETNRNAAPGASASEVYLVRPDGSGLRRLTTDGALTASPSWSRDSRSVVFARQFGASDGTRFPELFQRATAGGELRLTFDEFHDWDPAWSPDGRTLAFTSTRETLNGATFRIHVLDRPGRMRRLTTGAEGSLATSPSWTPDGRRLVYDVDPDGPVDPSVGYFGGTDLRVASGGPERSRVRVMRADGRGDQNLTDGSSSCVTPDVARRG